jgi:hypothetical protein
MRNHIWFGLVLAGLVACGTTNAAEDGENDSFTGGGKADGGGIADGTPEAIGVLRVANGSSLATLKSRVGLTKRTASHIISFRAGADATLGTSDDRDFRTLAELDAVPYVGPVAFDELLAYAEAQGDVPSEDPFAADPAGQQVASYDDVVQLFPPGTSFASLGRFNMFEQHRSCGAASCTPWQDTASLVFTTILNGGPGGQQVFQTLPLEGDVYLVARTNYPKANLYLELQGDPDASGNRLFTSCFVGPYTGDSSRAVIAARGLQTCDTSVTGFDEIAIERAGQGPVLDRLWGIQISDVAKVVPIDWGGTSASDLGYLTVSHLALVANQSADYYRETARLAVAADLSRP